MSLLIAAPEAFTAGAADLLRIGSSIRAATSAAAPATTSMLAAAEDEVSAAIAALFSSHAQEYQALSAQAEAFHAQFVHVLASVGSAYAAAETANVVPLQALPQPLETVAQDVVGVINFPTELLLGAPLIGKGTNGAPGTG